MRFFVDHNLFAATTQFLRDLGHDVITAVEASLADADDTDVLLAAENDDRVLVTRDRDFGNLVFVKELRGGVIYLRVTPTTLNSRPPRVEPSPRALPRNRTQAIVYRRGVGPTPDPTAAGSQQPLIGS